MMPISSYHPSARSVKVVLILIFIWAALMIGSTFWSISIDFTGISGKLHQPHQQQQQQQQQHAAPDPSPVPYAFGTILTGEGDTDSEVESPYFTAARLLTYQLLHSPDTRSVDNIPQLVLVTENIPHEQRTTLTKDGAVVTPVENITREWVHPKWERWSGVLAKLNIWKMTEYTKIAFLDADSILFERIDGIFTEPATALQQTKSDMLDGDGEEEEGRDALELPPTYMIAGIHDLWVEQNLPPTRESGKDFYVRNNYMNAGFFVLAPSETMFDYYLALLDQPGAFNPIYPEQNLLNCAHRIDGRMPWRDIGHHWNQKGASRAEYEGGLKSVHQKWWVSMGDEVLDGYVAKALGDMKAFVELAEHKL